MGLDCHPPNGACSWSICGAAPLDWYLQHLGLIVSDRAYGEAVQFAVEPDGVTFVVEDAGGGMAGVRLRQEVGLPEEACTFTAVRSHWVLRIDRPPVDRMEYLLALRHADGREELCPDPANPRMVDGAFGPKSVVEFAEYSPPRWVDAGDVAGEATELSIDSTHLGATVHGLLWSPPGLGEDAPLLVVHDGPEYDRLAGITRFLGSAGVPPVRALLLDPGHRDAWYSANDAYARALHDEVLPSVPASMRIGVGTSLGALAMLHAYRHRPGAFDALFLQSGSFFTPELDPQESGFAGFGAVTAFVARELSAAVPVVMTCGTVEENLANNLAMARRLGAELHEVRDAHNYTAWRDAFDPYLTGLLAKVLR